MEILVKVIPGFQSQRIAIETGNYWSDPQLLLSGTPVEGRGGHYTIRNDAGEDVAVTLKRNFFDPIPTLHVGSNSIELARPFTWYERIWMGIPFILVVYGGSVGVLFGVGAAYANARIFRGNRVMVAKYGLTAVVSLVMFLGYMVSAVYLKSLIMTQQ